MALEKLEYKSIIGGDDCEGLELIADVDGVSPKYLTLILEFELPAGELDCYQVVVDVAEPSTLVAIDLIHVHSNCCPDLLAFHRLSQVSASPSVLNYDIFDRFNSSIVLLEVVPTYDRLFVDVGLPAVFGQMVLGTMEAGQVYALCRLPVDLYRIDPLAVALVDAWIFFKH